MKLFQIMFLWACTLQGSFAQTFMVPDVGSVWESTSLYPATEDGRPERRQTQVIKVDRLLDGRPVFAGIMNGIPGKMMQVAQGTVVYADECKNDVPKEILAPPDIPNQCAWGVCKAPPVGETFTRPMIIYAPLFACQPQTAVYTFLSINEKVGDGIRVTIGKAVITFNGLQRSAWESHIEDGIGEVFAESPEKVTRYDKIFVPLIPYLPAEKPILSLAR